MESSTCSGGTTKNRRRPGGCARKSGDCGVRSAVEGFAVDGFAVDRQGATRAAGRLWGRELPVLSASRRRPGHRSRPGLRLADAGMPDPGVARPIAARRGEVRLHRRHPRAGGDPALDLRRVGSIRPRGAAHGRARGARPRRARRFVHGAVCAGLGAARAPRYGESLGGRAALDGSGVRAIRRSPRLSVGGDRLHPTRQSDPARAGRLHGRLRHVVHRRARGSDARGRIAGPARGAPLVDVVTHRARGNHGDRGGGLLDALGSRARRADDSGRRPSGQHRPGRQMESQTRGRDRLDL